jgi:DNA-binding HxlR family transcriptional regulator
MTCVLSLSRILDTIARAAQERRKICPGREKLTVMSKRTEDVSERCPMRTAIAVLAGKWKPLIVFYLRTGTKRFSEMRRLIPEASQQVLTQQLRELEEDGIVTRTIYPVVPPKVEYSLSPIGDRLGPVVDLLARWGEDILANEDPAASHA